MQSLKRWARLKVILGRRGTGKEEFEGWLAFRSKRPGSSNSHALDIILHLYLGFIDVSLMLNETF
jgi:hypothetical protein